MSSQREFVSVIKELGLPTPVKPGRQKGHVPSKVEKDIDVLENLLVNNKAGILETWGAVYDESQFKKAKTQLPAVLKKLDLESKEKEIKSQLDAYAKIFKKFTEHHAIVMAPVKTLPFKKVYMHKLPKIYENEKGSLEINEKPIGYIVELPYQVERSAAYGEMKDKEPLFAPVIGELELNWNPPDAASQSGETYIKDFVLQANFFEAFDKQTTRNSIWRYQNYGRKGEPICDILMKNEDLMVSMERVISEVDSKDFKANASVCGLMYAIDGRTIVGIVDFDGVQKNAFEALFKLTAYMEDLPRTSGGGLTSGGPGPASGTTPGGPARPSLPTWSQEDLQNRPGRFSGGTQPNLPVWTEDELEKRENKFTGSGPNLPVWTEEELSQLKRTSGPSLNLPEWKEEGLLACPKCGYSCQANWDECPICGTKIDGEKKPEKPLPMKSSPPASKPVPGMKRVKPDAGIAGGQEKGTREKKKDSTPPDAKKIE